MTKYVFVTGGVVSSLGKGIAAASLAAILESRGIRVTNIKLDPYINVDPGTMSPFQHGEVFVTEDGAETDLDLGPLRALLQREDAALEQLHHRPDLRVGDQEGAPGRLPRRHGAGHPAHHRRDQGLHQARRGRRRGGDRRGRRHGGRHRVAAVPRGDPADGPGAGPRQRLLHPPDAGAVHRLGRRDQDQADAALGQGAARDRHPGRRAAVPHRPAAARRRAPQDRAVLQRAEGGGDLGLGRRPHLQDPDDAAPADARRDRLPQAADPGARRRPVRLDQAGLRARASRSTRSTSPSSASTSTCRTPTSRSTRR